MRKTLFILPALICGFILFSAPPIAADWSKPIPVGSTQNQTGAGAPLTMSDATYIKFFKHPATTSGTNFSSNSIMVDGSADPVFIDDIVGTTGLLPDIIQQAPDFAGMLDLMIEEAYSPSTAHLSPTHGFCPEELKLSWIDSSTGDTIERISIIECDVLRSPSYRINASNVTDHQLEIADIKNASSDTEFATIIGASALESGVPGYGPPVGDARENALPYTERDYPATIRSRGMGDFTWIWKDRAIEEPYTHNYIYGTAQIDGGIVSALYDPVMVEKYVRWSLLDLSSTVVTSRDIEDSGSPVGPAYKNAYNKFILNHAPLVFFKGDDTTKRMLLAGYSAWQFDNLDLTLSGAALKSNVLNFFWKMISSLNLNPIDVVSLDNYLAVVNQATIGNIDGPVYDNMGKPTSTASGTPIKWRDLLSTDSSSIPLPESGSPGDVYFPHSVASYVVLWEKKHDWNHTDRLTDNPNEVFDNYLSRGTEEVPGFALVGANMFDVDVITDNIGGSAKKSLIVASGDIDKTNTSYYIYKISPDGEKLYIDGSIISSTFKHAIGIAGEPYKIEPAAPLGEGYRPYGIKTGNFNGDECGDVVVTWRGAQTVWDPPAPGLAPPLRWFENHDGNTVHDKVRFNRYPYNTKKEMFAEFFTIYYGKLSGSKCIFPDTPSASTSISMIRRAPEPKWQIAAVAISDLNADGRDDIIVGNLNPMRIEGIIPETCSAFAAIFYAAPDGSFPPLPDEFIRTGYAETKTCPDVADEGPYLIDVWKDAGGDKIAGVSALDIDSNGNIVSTNGLPLMLSSFGCPVFSPSDPADTEVESPIELLNSLRFNENNPGISWGDTNDIVPMRCPGTGGVAPITITPFSPTITLTLPKPCVTPPGVVPKCCVDDCTALSLSLLRECCNEACGTPADRDPPYDVLCNMLRPCCETCVADGAGCIPWSALDTPKDELFADDNAGSDGGDSAYAKCDRVYDSKAPYIASMADLKYAQAQVNEQMTANKLKISKPISEKTVEDIKNLLAQMEFSESEATEIINKLQKSLSDPFVNILVMPFLDIIGKLQVPENIEQQSALDKSNEVFTLSSLIKEANANTITDSDGDGVPDTPDGILMIRSETPLEFAKTRVRLPRGHVPPGKREVTVVVNKTPAVPPPEEDPFDTEDEDCPPCCPPCETCSLPAAETIVVKCVGGSSPAAIEKMAKMNELARAAIGPGLGSNDLFCESEAMFKYFMNVDSGGAPTLSRDTLINVNPDLAGNVGNFAMIQVSGNRTMDFTKEIMLPVKTDMIGKPTVLLPVTSDVSSSFGKTTILGVDLSLTSDATPFGVNLSEATPITSDTVSSYDVLENNKYSLNNVVSLQVTSANNQSRGVGEIGESVIEASLRGQPLLCSWAGSCPDSEAFESGMNFDKVDFDQVLNVLRANADLCVNGVCSPELFQKLNEEAGWPLYTMNTIAFVQNRVAKRGETPGAQYAAAASTAFGPPMYAARGGCGCDITASVPSTVSIITLLILAALSTTGYVLVREKIRKRK